MPIDVNHSDWDPRWKGARSGCSPQPHPWRRPAALPAGGAPGAAAGRRLLVPMQRSAPAAAVRRRRAGDLRAPKTWPCAPGWIGTTCRPWPQPMRCVALSGHRRQQMWDAAARRRARRCCATPGQRGALELPRRRRGRNRLRLRRHGPDLAPPPTGPAARPRLARWRLLGRALQLQSVHGRSVRACGIVAVRQQPARQKAPCL